MKKLLITSLLGGMIVARAACGATAAFAGPFNGNLSYGTTGSADVTSLQQFLQEEGIYAGPITGNFFSLTIAAVKSFQEQNGVTPVSGYFGPLTRAKANAIVAAGITSYNRQFNVTTTPTTTGNTMATSTNSIQAVNNFTIFLEARIGNLFQQLQNLWGGSGKKGGGATPSPTPTSGSSGGSSGGAPSSTPAPALSVAILPATLSAGSVGVSYSQTLTASTTATGTFTWNVNSGVLPPGLAFVASSKTTATVISGTPTETGIYIFSITARDGTSSSTAPYAITITSKPTSTLSVAVSVSGGVANVGNFDLTIVDGSSTLFNGIASSGQSVTVGQGDTYSVAEATTTGSANYAVAFGTGCSGTMPTSSVTCFVTNTSVAPPATGGASTTALQWGAYVGDGTNSLSNFESLVGAPVDILADFEDWSAGSFPSYYASNVGAAGKTLLIFWEPQYSYDTINSGKEDSVITQFAAAAKIYGYPVILAPFDEMNINENTWGAYQGTNTPAKFIQAWQHVHSFFTGDPNVKFAWDVNNVSVPNNASNSIASYYPGSAYVDYVGMDGFNFGNPTQSFDQVFDPGIAQLEIYGKPIYIFSTASTEYSGKASWITEGLGTHIKTYSDIAGWIWFNQNDATTPGSGDTINWTVNSDSSSLAAFQNVIP